VADRLTRDGGVVVIIDLDPKAVAWVQDHPAASRLAAVTGMPPMTRSPARPRIWLRAWAASRGWVNNAAMFRDAALGSAAVGEVAGLIVGNLHPGAGGLSRRDPPFPDCRDTVGHRQRVLPPG
jgi:hypothetical protein